MNDPDLYPQFFTLAIACVCASVGEDLGLYPHTRFSDPLNRYRQDHVREERNRHGSVDTEIETRAACIHRHRVHLYLQ